MDLKGTQFGRILIKDEVPKKIERLYFFRNHLCDKETFLLNEFVKAAIQRKLHFNLKRQQVSSTQS